MKQVITLDKDTILAKDVPRSQPVFAVNRNGKVMGMVVQEEQGWIIRSGGGSGWNGYYDSFEQLIFFTSDLVFITDLSINL